MTAAGFQLKGSGWYVTDFRNTAQVAGGEKEKKKNDASATIGDKPRGDTSAGAAPTNAKAAGKPA